MCNPQGTTKEVSSKWRINAITLVAGLFGFFMVILPMILSEMWGGWTREYTSSASMVRKDMTGQVAIVTGANTGIGFHTALELARQNATVVVAARSATKGQNAIDRMQQELSEDADFRFLSLDLSSLDSVRDFAANFQGLGLPLHLLILNAGIMKSPGQEFVGRNFTYGFDTTKEGFESHIGVNHIGHYYLTRLLQQKLVDSAPARVVSVSSMAERGAYEEGIRFSSWKPQGENKVAPADYEDGLAYGQSKLANIFFAKELAEHLSGTGVTAYSCHPGIIMTELGRYMEEVMLEEVSTQGMVVQMLTEAFGRWFQTMQMTSRAGALTQLHLATAADASLVNGAYYLPVGKLAGHGSHPQATNVTLQNVVWKETERMILEAGFQF